MNRINYFIRQATKIVPSRLRAFVRSHISLTDYDRSNWESSNPFLNVPTEIYPESRFCLGIIQDISHYHRHYIAACREMEVSYKVVNLLADDWISQFVDSGCDAFVVWPSSLNTVVKHLFDYRLYIAEHDLGLLLYPSWQECWLTEFKPRLRDWMIAKNIPHPKTWIFHDRRQALDFVDNTQLPIIVKTATGASATGVYIARSHKQLREMVFQAFGKGFRPRGFDVHDRQRGFIFLQEYVQIEKEWRLVRIGDSFFGHPKGRIGDFHSGSGSVLWDVPDTHHINFIEKITDMAGFKSMNVDVFEDRNGVLLVNELHSVFGSSYAGDQLKVDGVPGRLVRKGNNDNAGEWQFEAGDFCRNHMCNLRLEYLLDILSDRE